ncbi:uncharacterized protein LOC131259677 [Anopheles coustani]|nr:uncharacterized protein LOC131259677 [Anopheles coustani]
MLRDRIVIGVLNKRLQHKLLERQEGSLERVIETCKTFEATSDNKQILEQKSNLLEVKGVQQPEGERQIAAINKRLCFKCGGAFNQNHRSSCPATNVACYRCGSVGHFSKCCRRKNNAENYNNQRQQRESTSNKNAKTEKTSKTVAMINWSDAE